MNINEKLDVIMQYIVADTRAGKDEAIAIIREIIENGKEDKQFEDMNDVITNILLEIGVPSHVLGYFYLKQALKFVVEDEKYIFNITKMLYPAVAEKFNTTSSKTERAIRHAITCAWDRCDCDVVYRYFGNSISPSKDKPTNSEFIARVATIIRERVNGKTSV